MDDVYKYKNINNMNVKELKDFAKDPTKWLVKQLRDALMYDPLLTKCYTTYASIHQCIEPFDHKDFLIFLSYQALMSNSINMKQLIEILKLVQDR